MVSILALESAIDYSIKRFTCWRSVPILAYNFKTQAKVTTTTPEDGVDQDDLAARMTA